VPAPQANEVAARLRPPPEARAGMAGGLLRCVRGCFKVVKSDISGVLREFSVFSFKCSAWTAGGADTGRNGREAALDMTTPHPQSPLNPSPR